MCTRRASASIALSTRSASAVASSWWVPTASAMDGSGGTILCETAAMGSMSVPGILAQPSNRPGLSLSTRAFSLTVRTVARSNPA
mgnify:CR=1 FL=1